MEKGRPVDPGPALFFIEPDPVRHSLDIYSRDPPILLVVNIALVELRLMGVTCIRRDCWSIPWCVFWVTTGCPEVVFTDPESSPLEDWRSAASRIKHL